MINATQMAKSFRKSPGHWALLKSSKVFIDKFSVLRKIKTADLVRVIQGGNPQLQGTWMHEDVALEFARWLSPEFAIWCNDRIKEILLEKANPGPKEEIHPVCGDIFYWIDLYNSQLNISISASKNTNRCLDIIDNLKKQLKITEERLAEKCEFLAKLQPAINNINKSVNREQQKQKQLEQNC